MTRSRRVILDWYRITEETEEVYEVELSVGPAEPRGTPFVGTREVEVITVRDHHGCREDILEQIPDADLEELYARAVSEAAEADLDAYHWEMDRRMEEDRDR